MRRPPQLGLFDVDRGAPARREGAAAASLAAGPLWREQAFDALRRFLVAYGSGEFLAERAIGWILERDLCDRPPDPRAWGAPFVLAKKRGFIVRAGSTSVGTSNASPKPLWRRA